MQPQGTPNRAVATRLVAAVRTFARSEVGWRAKLIFATILVLLIGANGLDVASSFVNRNLMSAIAERHTAAFVWQAELTLAVFAGSTIVAVLARFAEERLGLLWREFVTERAVAGYMANGTYYRLAMPGELANPDQRIAEDTRAFTASTLSFALMAINSAFTILSFSGVLWSISPLLRARLVSDDQARPAARQAEQRLARPRGELPLCAHPYSRRCRRY
jgi:putative ATP-binding cassette transporter